MLGPFYTSMCFICRIERYVVIYAILLKPMTLTQYMFGCLFDDTQMYTCSVRHNCEVNEALHLALLLDKLKRRKSFSSRCESLETLAHTYYIQTVQMPRLPSSLHSSGKGLVKISFSFTRLCHPNTRTFLFLRNRLVPRCWKALNTARQNIVCALILWDS